MKIIIFAPTSTKITPTSLKLQPLGGADRTLLKMAYYLSAGSSYHEANDVWLYGNCDSYGDNDYEGVKFRNYEDLFLREQECDILIHYRKMWAIPPNLRYKKAIFYSQDTADTPCFAGLHKKKTSDNVFDIYDKVVVLSNFHMTNLMDSFEIPVNKIEIIGNAANGVDMTTKEDLTFVYASTPFRGLHILAKLWKEIIKKYPEAKLHVFSAMKIYGAEVMDEIEFAPLYEILRNMKGVIYHGSVVQDKMLEVMKKAHLHLYPNVYPETYCNVVMEARACHTPTITTWKGALPETMGMAGELIHGDPYTSEYQEQFLNAVDKFINDRSVYNDAQEKCYPIRQWADYGEDILRLVENVAKE